MGFVQLRAAGQRQEASGIMSFPWSIQTSVSRSWLACGGSPSESGRPDRGKGCGGGVARRYVRDRRPTEKLGWPLPPAKLQLRGPGVVRGRSSHLGWQSNVFASHMLDKQHWVCDAPSWRHAASPDAEAELCLTCSHVGIVGVFVRGPKTVAKSGCAAARGQEGCWGVRNQASSVMGTWMIPPRQLLREGSAPVEHKGRA